MSIINKIQNALTPHYLIIRQYGVEVIMGCCCGKSGQADVLAKEPLSTFEKISKRKCPFCGKSRDTNRIINN